MPSAHPAGVRRHLEGEDLLALDRPADDDLLDQRRVALAPCAMNATRRPSEPLHGRNTPSDAAEVPRGRRAWLERHALREEAVRGALAEDDLDPDRARGRTGRGLDLVPVDAAVHDQAQLLGGQLAGVDEGAATAAPARGRRAGDGRRADQQCQHQEQDRGPGGQRPSAGRTLSRTHHVDRPGRRGARERGTPCTRSRAGDTPSSTIDYAPACRRPSDGLCRSASRLGIGAATIGHRRWSAARPPA